MSEPHCPNCRKLEREMKRREEAWEIERQKLLHAIRRESEQWERTPKTSHG